MSAVFADVVLMLHFATIVLLIIGPHISFTFGAMVGGIFSIGQLTTHPFCPLTLLELKLRSGANHVYWDERRKFRVLALAFAHAHGIISSIPDARLVKKWRTWVVGAVVTGVTLSWCCAFAINVGSTQ